MLTANIYNYEKRLKTILTISISSIAKKNTIRYEKITGPYLNSIVLAGAGDLGRKTLSNLYKAGIKPLCFADNDKKLHDKQIDGLPVLSLCDSVKHYGEKAAFVVTIYNSSVVREQLCKLGCKRVVPFSYFYWKYSEIFLPYLYLDLPRPILCNKKDVKNGLLLWDDDLSRNKYVEQVNLRLTLGSENIGKYSPVGQTYFPEDLFSLAPNDVFIDCGAFNGDTIRAIISKTKSKFDKIIAFEADPSSCEQLRAYVSGLQGSLKRKIFIHQLVVGKRKEKLFFEALGSVNSNIARKGRIEVESAPLDLILDGYNPTYIKMDIEGAELDGLSGAKKIIKRFSPILAICLYHKVDDLWKIPLYIKSISNNYRFFLRSYAEDGWELMFYAIPKWRLRTKE